MKFHPQSIPGVFVIEPTPFADDRGVFRRHFCERELASAGIVTEIKQCNASENFFKHTLRGFHYQLPPHAEGKTLSCFRGAMYDIVVDLRPSSATYLKWVGVQLDERNRLSLHVPPGCANAFLTLEDHTLIYYYCSNFYHPAAERGLRYDDPLFAFAWPVEPAIVSDKDRAHPDYVPEQRREEFRSLDAAAPRTA